MNNIFKLICISLFLFTFSCDDGDVIVVELDFDQDLEKCGDENSSNYVLYDIREDPYESLSLLFPVSTTNTLIFKPTTSGTTTTLTINASTIRFNYRTYDADPSGLFCQDIPDSGVNIITDYEAPTGTATFISAFEDDDEDGIASEDEDIDGDGDYTNDDTDGDDIPNYLDADDDNDNILTINEDIDDDDDSTNDDTDGDNVPNYLDEDDDGDNILTRNEDEDGNNNPRNDYDEETVLGSQSPATPRYLDNGTIDADDVFTNDNFVETTYTRNYTVTVTITNVDLTILGADTIELGTYTYSVDSDDLD